jgi:hypothetical protein
MPRAERRRRYRSTELDRALAPARTVVTVGPLETPSVDRLREVLRAAEIHCAEARLTLVPDAGERWWRYEPDVADRAVVAVPDVDTTDPARLVTEVRTRPGVRAPVEVLVCRDHLVMDYSHGVGDGQFGPLGLAILAADDPSRAALLSDGLSSNAVWTALWRHYRSRPSALREFWRIRKENKKAGPDDTGLPRKRIENWEAAKSTVSVYLEPATVARLRSWAKENKPGATTASLTVAVWLAALRAEGVRYDRHVMILMNCRRYLGPEYATAQGNFAVGIPIPMPPSENPADIAALVRRIIESGWPLAILGMAELRSLLRGPRAPGHPAVIEVPDRVRLSVSDIGRLTAFDGQEWAGDRPPQLSAFLEPDGPDAVTLLVSELEGGRTLTASFCSAMIGPDIVTAALNRVRADPVALLAER